MKRSFWPCAAVILVSLYRNLVHVGRLLTCNLCVCSWRWQSRRCANRHQQLLLRPGHSEPALPTEEWHVCVERRQRTALEGPRQCSEPVQRTSQDRRAPSDWLHPFWRSVARLRSALQRLPAAVYPSPEGRNQPLPNKGGLRGPPALNRAKTREIDTNRSRDKHLQLPCRFTHCLQQGFTQRFESEKDVCIYYYI